VATLKLLKTDSYPQLLRQVRQTLIDGQSRLEKERVRIYWQTGRHIHTHILKHKERADYGKDVVGRLSKDINVSETVLHRCIKFAQSYPDLKKVAAPPLLGWSHYVNLITITDQKKRRQLEKASLENEWSSDELAARIKEEVEPTAQSPQPTAQSAKLLIPLRGVPYTYQITDRPSISSGKSSLRLDLGFGIFLNDTKLISGFVKDQIVELRVASQPNQPNQPNQLNKPNKPHKLFKSIRTAKDLYTYWAEIERVIDGDTVKVRFDLGFGVEVRETLRLRGLDCPEMNTKEGQQAKAFVQSHLKEEQYVIVRSSRSDKYDRYLADIFIPQDSADPKNPMDSKNSIYLNNLLLEQGYAKRMD
jgi:endonuclease YncB( thermonuclease family)